MRQVSRAESRASLDRPTGWNLTISSTFSAEPLEEILSFWMSELGVPSQMQFAPYDWVWEHLGLDQIPGRSFMELAPAS